MPPFVFPELKKIAMDNGIYIVIYIEEEDVLSI